MKVKQLIQELEKLDWEKEVWLEWFAGSFCGDVEVYNQPIRIVESGNSIHIEF